MRGAYIARLDLDAPHAAGVAKKIMAQRIVLADALGETELFHTSAKGVVRDGQVIAPAGAGRMAHRMQHMFQFHRAVADALEFQKPDFCYIRYQRCGLGFLSMLRRLRKANPGMAILIEIPSFPYHTEENSHRDRVLGHIDRILRGRMAGLVDRIVTFSRRNEILGIPTIQTDNGTDVMSVSVLPLASGSPIRLLGLANLSFWHGYDRVITGLARYQGGRDVIFDIVGNGRELARLQSDVFRLGVEDRVRFHGPLQGAALDAVMVGVHIGISSIGMHRLQVETSNLKSREFCSRGLPFVIAYQDPDFSSEQPFIHWVSADDTPLDIAAVVNFRERLSVTMPDFTKRMRLYAVENLSWEAKMEPVVSAVRDLVSRGRT